MYKKAILVISFGTSYLDNLKVTIQAVEETVSNALPEYKVERAFTSNMVINHIKERDGVHINNVSEALQKLIDGGFREVYCLPTHIMNGVEYNKIVAELEKVKHSFDILKIARPLISVTEDYPILINALFHTINFSDDKYYILMGHGTNHFANAIYCALDYHFKHNNFENVYIATVEGFPELDDVIKQLSAKPKKEILLIPLMLVAGDHANNDMIGSEEGSWKSILESNGYKVSYLLKGLGEYPLIQNIYLNHLLDIIK